MHSTITQKIIGYYSPNLENELPTTIHSLGWETQSSTNYYYDGSNRKAETGNCIFQYTLSGCGAIEIEGTLYHLSAGDAFLVSLPGNHRYYLPDNSTWEFLFVTLRGSYSTNIWNSIIEKRGHVISISPDDSFVTFLWDFYKTAYYKKNRNAYEVSASAYHFLMQLQSQVNPLPFELRDSKALSPSINSAIQFMNKNLANNIGLEDIATSVDMTKYYFDRSFKKETGISPWTYFTKLRIEHAARLLLTSDITINEVSLCCGFDSSNYFNKVFRKYVGISAGGFRELYKKSDNFTFTLL